MAVIEHAEPAAPPLGCAWCGRPHGSGDERLQGRIRCAACGAATTDPWPSDAELDRAYRTWYRPPSGRFSAFGDALLRRTRGRLARRIDRVAPSGPVLDVGAGEGALLEALRARGREASGLERESARDDVRSAEVTEVGGRCAAVVFWHSLEHLRAPAAALEGAVGLLEPRGVLIVSMPNTGSLQARVFGERWFALDLPRHLVHVSAKALLDRLRELGLEVERISFLRGGQVVFGWLHGLVGALPSRPDLYDAIRRPEARRAPMSGARRIAALGAAALLLPVAAVCAIAEAAARRGGTVYVEARRVR